MEVDTESPGTAPQALRISVCQVQSPSPGFRGQPGRGCPGRLPIGDADSGHCRTVLHADYVS